MLADQFDAGPAQCLDHLGQGFDYAAHGADAALHPLDGRQGQPGHLGKRLLVNSEQCPRRLHLERRDHAIDPYSGYHK